MNTSYRYVATSLVGGRPLEELPLTEVTYSRWLNGAGSFSATLPLVGVGKNVWDASTPGKVLIWVYRGSAVVGAFIPWVRDYTAGSSSASLQGADVWSYFTRRLVRNPVSWVDTDSAAIVTDLIVAAQAAVGGNIGVSPPTSTSGVKLSRTIYSTEARFVADEVESLSTHGYGFTWDIRPEEDMVGQRSLKFLINPRSSEQLAAVYPGNTSDVQLTDMGSEIASAVLVQGGASSVNWGSVDGYSVFTDAIDSGFPLLEATVQAPTVTSADSLRSFTEGVAKLRRYGVQVGKLKVDPRNPALGTYHPGDRVRIKVDGGAVSVDRMLTLVGFDVQAPGDGREESVTWTVSDTVGGR
jgi:hypothetical protein